MNVKSIVILFIIFLMIINTAQLKAQNNENSNSLNKYSFDLYRETKAENENLFLSPLSTYYALLVAYKGSKNKTKQEFEKVLYLKSSGSLINDYLYNLASKSDSCSGFKVSNAIWVDKSLQIEEGYKKTVTSKYFSDFMQTEFAHTELAVSAINRWVSEKTNQRINEIVSTANINSDTKILISNAVYFKGEWLNKFEKQRTISAPFFTNAENQYKVDFMNMTESLPYYENDDYQVISKPYRNSDLSFCIILPKKLFGIEEIEKKMNNDFFKKILDSTNSTETALSIPKLKLESSYMLKDALINAGLESAFTDKADFTGITKEQPLWLGQVVHKTWIELDEEKTEAAAATTTVMIKGLPSYKVFKADHPFVFFIIDKNTKAILFMGRYVKPSNGETIEKESLIRNLEKRKNEKFAIGSTNKILYLVDKKNISQAEFGRIKPGDIESIEVVKNEDISKYSSGNYNGVIVITLKKKKNQDRIKQ
ncbi:MAG: serpin family protein [Janthinobacterium lividum]